jgi:4-alpha-methyl-delta7-sterol-4alpha-methyl oxidase
MLETIAAWYSEPLFWLFPVATNLLAAFVFMVFAVPFTVLAARDPEWARPYRIQSRPPRAQQLVGPSIKSWAVNNAWVLAGAVVAWPLLRLSGVHAGPLPPVWVVVGQLVFFFYLDDFLYYWSHRTLHRPWLYKRIHGWHHRIVTPWAITGNYMHPLELSITGTVAMVGPLLLGSHVAVVWLWFVWRQWEAAEGHSGYDFPWTPSHFIPGNDGARHHDAHHARVKGNYAGFTPLPDRLFGTYVRGYREDLAARRASATKAVTVSAPPAA